jgi:hypothetical protein
MNVLELERRGVTLVAAITALTGAAQMVAAAPLLALIAHDAAPSAAHLFATVGMFMLVLGGATLHAQRRPQALDVVLLWGAVQKLLAAALVAWGVGRGVFIPLALAVAGFDGLSGLLYLDLRRRGG